MSEIMATLAIGLPAVAARKNEEMKKNLRETTLEDDLNAAMRNEQLRKAMEEKNAKNKDQGPGVLPAPTNEGDSTRTLLEQIAGMKSNQGRLEAAPVGGPKEVQKGPNHTPLPKRITTPAPLAAPPLR